ncbi:MULTISPECIES: dihydroorotase [unclassified Caballeronia]|uniref:dihydroorotase n=1 Tax=unclassified Caballeronia TaxID=2646786 RepID=UPI00285AB9B4|nr:MULTISPECIES: dihydroorotase [unclassified Caballeronia]MDR5736717.1 dihydroorotase [Caballeronia sp. LZ016]MDR5810802.1 dihydroorotase [Caballeronia sp. LZ019]
MSAISASPDTTASTTTPASLTLARPDDWHLHVRDGATLAAVLPHTARQFGRAIIMPNLKPPVTTTEMAAAYRERILAALPKEGAAARFEPLMTLYLTDNTPPEEIHRARECGFVHGVKLYPAGATTNSDAGVTDLAKCAKTLEAMQASGMPLLIHGEVTDGDIDVFDREKVFIDRVMTPLRRDFPELKVVFEHITTKDAAEYVRDADGAIGATITAHHLLFNRNAMLVGGIRPHYFCLPVIKRETHRVALVEAATSGNSRFFLGTDSAPHPKGLKEHACGCAGCYTALHALELYAEAFDKAGAIDRLEGFASFHGADFYGLPRSKETVTLERASWTLPAEFDAGDTQIVPLRGGEPIGWRFVDGK